MVVKYTKAGGSPIYASPTSGGTAADLPNHGVSVLTSAADIWTMQKPETGCFKILVWSAAGTSNARVIELSTTSSADSVTLIQGGTSGIAATEILIATTDAGSIGLVGMSTNTWKSLWTTTGHGAPSTGVVYQAS